MGKHYVPQRYLRNFEDPAKPGLIWLFDKRKRVTNRAAISKVAQEPDFYDEEVEARLTKDVERPANPVIQKLCDGQVIGKTERRQLAVYIAVMLKRVPRRREHGFSLIPEVVASTISNVRAMLSEARRSPFANQEILSRHQAELDALHEKYQRETPPVLLEQLRTPWASDQMLDLIDRMAWRVVAASGTDLFLTSDNPAFFFGAYGLGNRESELSFPLSSRRVLHGCWQGKEGGLQFIGGKPALVREMNRRVASTTSRFAFYHENADWMHDLLAKPDPFLSRIRW